MKYLEIKDGKGYYWNDKEMVEIDQVSKDDLLKLINHAEEDGFEMDAYDENLLPNKAHQIIYQSLHAKLSDFLTDKEQFKRDVDAMYAKAVGEYGADLGAETDEEEVEETDAATDVEEDVHPNDIPF